jgi:parallel beta-helix repeat protein
LISLFLVMSSSSPSIAAVPSQASLLFMANGSILYVGGIGPGNYSKIQDAVDNASTGDIVFVYRGFYAENLCIRTSIHLIGEENTSTVIDGGGYGTVVTISADNTILQGFTIQNAKNDVLSAGVEISTANDVLVTGNIIQGNAGLGLYARGPSTSRTTIEKNTIQNNSYGIHLQDSPQATISANNISGNGEGVYIIGSFESQLMNNIIVNRGIGLHFENSFGSRITGNWIVDNANGVYVFNSSEMTFEANTIRWNRWYGIWLKDCSECRLDGNRISENVDVGFFLESSYDTTVINNTLWNNDNGIYLKDSSGNIIQNNNLRNYKMNACFVAHTLIHRRNLWQMNYWERARMLPYPILGVIKLEKVQLTWINVDWIPLQHPPQLSVSHNLNRDGAILYVGGNGPNNYSSIQQAVNDAQQNDTVYVYNGTYYEGIIINKPLWLLGENKTTTILDGNGTRDIITVIADYVRIKGFTVQHGHFNILVNHSSFGTVAENNINNGLQGLSVQDGCHFLTISNNSFKENVYGIRLYSSTDVTISRNSVTSFKINAFFFGTSLAHGRNHWHQNYWGQPRYLPYVIIGKIRLGNFSLVWFNVDWSPLRNPS